MITINSCSCDFYQSSIVQLHPVALPSGVCANYPQNCLWKWTKNSLLARRYFLGPFCKWEPGINSLWSVNMLHDVAFPVLHSTLRPFHVAPSSYSAFLSPIVVSELQSLNCSILWKHPIPAFESSQNKEYNAESTRKCTCSSFLTVDVQYSVLAHVQTQYLIRARFALFSALSEKIVARGAV